MDSIKFAKCFIYAEVLNTSGAPYGGVSLGYSKEGTEFFPNVITADEEIEEEAGINDTRDLGANPYLLIVLTEFQTTTLKYLFNSSRISGSTTSAKVHFPGDLVAGKSLPSYKFLVVPEDYTNIYSLYIPNGQPVFKNEESIKFKLKDYSVYPLIIRCKSAGLLPADTNYKNRKALYSLLSNITIF